MEQICNQIMQSGVSTAVFCFQLQVPSRPVYAPMAAQPLTNWNSGLFSCCDNMSTCKEVSSSFSPFSQLDYLLILLMVTLLVFQVAMVSGAALASPAQFQVRSVQTAAFRYVTYSAPPYCQPVRCHCLCPLHYCLYELASERNMGSRWDTCKTFVTLHQENNSTSAPCRALTAKTLRLPVSVCGAPGVRCIASWNIARKAARLSTCSLQRRITLETSSSWFCPLARGCCVLF